MIPMELFALKHYTGNDSEDCKGYNLLDNLELHKSKWASITYKTNFIGWHLKHILEECNAPREENDKDKRPRIRNVHLLKFKMAIPSESHEDIAADKEQHCIKRVHEL